MDAKESLKYFESKLYLTKREQHIFEAGFAYGRKYEQEQSTKESKEFSINDFV